MIWDLGIFLPFLISRGDFLKFPSPKWKKFFTCILKTICFTHLCQWLKLLFQGYSMGGFEWTSCLSRMKLPPLDMHHEGCSLFYTLTNFFSQPFEVCRENIANCHKLPLCQLLGFLYFHTSSYSLLLIAYYILKEINAEYSLEVLMLKLQYFGHLMKRAN